MVKIHCQVAFRWTSSNLRRQRLQPANLALIGRECVVVRIVGQILKDWLGLGLLWRFVMVSAAIVTSLDRLDS